IGGCRLEPSPPRPVVSSLRCGRAPSTETVSDLAWRRMAVETELEQEVRRDACAIARITRSRADVIVAARPRGVAAATAEQLAMLLEARAKRRRSRQTVGKAGAGGRAADLTGRTDRVARARAHAVRKAADGHPALVAGG